VLWAFVEAGIVAIAAMLWIALHRFGDVLLTLVPLLVAGAVTMELMVVLGQSLNFANVIAFPLLLGVGIAFKILGRTGRLVRAAKLASGALGGSTAASECGYDQPKTAKTLDIACAAAAAGTGNDYQRATLGSGAGSSSSYRLRGTTALASVINGPSPDRTAMTQSVVCVIYKVFKELSVEIAITPVSTK
jgi:hypothetical protein